MNMDVYLTIVLLHVFYVSTLYYNGSAEYHTHEYPRKLEEAVKIGKSLQFTTIRGLQPHIYWVEASGGVENYSKWPLLLHDREMAFGYPATPLSTVVKAGEIEGFSSYKRPGTASGIWVRYTSLLDDDVLVHFMYSAPFDFNYNHNWLAVGLCGNASALCRSMTAKKMYYGSFSFVDKKEYSTFSTPAVKVCYDDVCMSGNMERIHRPTMIIRVFPKSYYDLHPRIQANAINPKEYDSFIKARFKL